MNKAFLVTIAALFALLTVSIVSASELTGEFEVTVDGIEYDSHEPIGIEAGETIPIKVVFTATEDAQEVTLKSWIDGYRSDISDKTGRFELVDGSTYSKKFSLTVPSDVDPTEDYTLYVRLSDKTKSYEEEFELRLQRDSYNLEILSAETEDITTPGSVIAVDVVLKNWGMHELEDVYVKASIPDLGVERKVYFGDVSPLDECEFDDDFKNRGSEYENYDCDGSRKDAVERRIYLSIPNNARAGTYNLEVEAYNVDTSDIAKKSIVISKDGISEVFSGIASKTLDIGETVTYDLILINSGNTLKVFNIVPENVKGLIVEVEPVVTVSAGSSKTVKVDVRATESAEEGTHTFTINVNSDGELVKQATFTANVEKGAGGQEGVAGSIILLTVILAIVFIVLLIILIVLLTKRPAAIETEETSYY